MSEEKVFTKYRERGSLHWREMMSRSIRRFNAFQQARYDWIIKSAGDVAGKNVLDLGCGDGSLSYLLAKRGAKLTGVDNETLGIDFARQNLESQDPDHKLTWQFLVASVYELPFPDNHFDLVVHCEVIEHLADPARMLKEAARVLKPGGKFILTTPHRLTETPGDANHFKEYFPRELEALLKKHFSEAQIKLTHHVFWYGFYTYAFRQFGNRQFGKWFINFLSLWFGFNPFMIDYPKPTKQDIFTQILAISRKT